jgi:hypothetical protein
MAEISQEWSDVLLQGGTSYVQECECGITHFCDRDVEPQAWPEEEDEYYEKLVGQIKQNNPKYMMHQESIGYGHANNWCIVIGCPCGRDKRVEDWIWSHKEMISRYLNARIMRELEEKVQEFSGTCVTPTADLLERIESTMQNAMDNFKKLVHGTD